MKIRKETIHQDVARCELSEKQIKTILVDWAAKTANFGENDNFEAKVILSTRDLVGTAGIENYARIVLTKDLKSESTGKPTRLEGHNN